MGVTLLALIGWFVFGQKLNAPSIAGIVLIVAGVLMLNVFGGVHEPDPTAVDAGSRADDEARQSR